MAGNKLTNYIIWSVPRSFDLPNFSSLFFFHCYSISREVSFDDSANLTYWGPHGSWKEADWLTCSTASQVSSAFPTYLTGWHYESNVISGKQRSSSIFSFLKPSSQNPGAVQWQPFRTFWNAKWLVNSNCKPLKGYLSSTAAGKEKQQWTTHISNLCTTDTKRACGCHFDHLECYPWDTSFSMFLHRTWKNQNSNQFLQRQAFLKGWKSTFLRIR